MARTNQASFSSPQLVLDKLVEATGASAFPPIEIEITKSTNYVARYLATSSIIQIEQKALTICKSFGKDSLTVLAFIIGHELAHAQRASIANDKPTSYLAWDRGTPTDHATEQAADVQGVFCAYLAGYKKYYELLPQLLDAVYRDYGLTDARLANYPPQYERKQSAKVVIEKVEQLVQVYEAATYLSAIGQYELAARSLEYVSKHYLGRELYNNIGVNYLLWAMNAPDQNALPYLYPLEIDWDTRLKKPLAPGAKDSDDWKSLLSKADGNLRKAIGLDADYLPAEINLLCAWGMMGYWEKALGRYQKNKLVKKAKTSLEQDHLQLAFALANTYSASHEQTAKAIWEQLATESISQQVRNQATYNLKILKGESCTLPAPFECVKPFPTDIQVDGARLHRPPFSGSQHWEVVLCDSPITRLYVTRADNSTLLHFEKNGKNQLCLQRIPCSHPFNKMESMMKGRQSEVLSTPTGFFMVCDPVVFLVNENEEMVVEWCKYHVFN